MSLISKEHLKFLLKNIKALLSRKADKSDIVQSNWEQNDESALDYVKNRTHWEEEVENIILPEMTIEGFELMEEPLYAVLNAFSIELELNKTYTVVWDGVKYDVEYKEFEEFDGLGYLGNENYVTMNGGGNIPFALIFADGIFVATESSATSHTISITTSETTVHKIDEKYLPKIASTPDWNQNDPNGEGYIKNRPFYKKILPTSFIPEETITEYWESGNGNYYGTISTPFEFVENKGYVIYIDGLEYFAIGSFFQTYSYYYYVGNGNLYNSDLPNTGENFVIIKEYEPEYGTYYYFVTTDNAPHTISVYEAEVAKIESLYLPTTKPLIINEQMYNGHDIVNITTVGKSGVGNYSEAFNNCSTQNAIGDYSHVEGDSTQAVGKAQHVQGRYNVREEPKVLTSSESGSSYYIKTEAITYADEYTYDLNTKKFTLVSPISGTFEDIKSKKCYYVRGSTASDLSVIYYKSRTNLFSQLDSFYRFYEIRYTINYEDKYAHVVGNGNYGDYSNAHTLDWEGNAWYQGDIYVGSTSGTNKDEGSKKLATEEHVNAHALTLTDVDNALPMTSDSWSVCYGNGKFVAVSKKEAKAMYSSDGFNWEIVPMPSYTADNLNYSEALIYGNNKFVSVGQVSYPYIKTIISYSDNGIDWKSANSPINAAGWADIIYGNNMYIALRRGGDYIYSTDGVNWLLRSFPHYDISKIAYGNGTFVAVGLGTTALYSTDGINWSTAQITSTSIDIQDASIAYGAGKFVYITYWQSGNTFSRHCFYSTDGITWLSSSVSTKNIYNLSNFTYTNNQFILVNVNPNVNSITDGYKVYSNDGINWEQVRLNDVKGKCGKIAYGDGTYVVMPTDGGTNYLYNWSKTHKEIFQNDTNVTDTIINDNQIATKEYTQNALYSPKRHFTLIDDTTFYEYIIRMQNGNLTSICKASSLAVSTLPTKTTYTVGEALDLTDMVVTLIRQDGATEEVDNYSYTEPDMSAAGTVDVTVSYVEAGETYSATFTITITEATTTEETETTT